jgi:hypothetical protein
MEQEVKWPRNPDGTFGCGPRPERPRNSNGTFGPGQPAPAPHVRRRKGSSNRLPREIREALVEGPARVGSDGRGTGGLAGFCEQAAREAAERKDRAAYLPVLSKLAPPAKDEEVADSGGRLELKIFAVPRGCQVDPRSGMITYADGTVAEAPPFQPYEAKPALDETEPGATAPVVAVEPMTEPVAEDDKLAILDFHRRKRTGDDGPPAA